MPWTSFSAISCVENAAPSILRRVTMSKELKPCLVCNAQHLELDVEGLKDCYVTTDSERRLLKAARTYAFMRREFEKADGDCDVHEILPDLQHAAKELLMAASVLEEK